MSSFTISEAIDIALAYQNTGDMKEAENIFMQILDFSQNIPDVWHLLGICRIHIKSYDGAIEAIENAIRLDPTKATYYTNLGEAYRRSGKFESAKESFLEALRLSPNSVDVAINLANTYKSLNETQKAIEQYKVALAIEPNDKDAIYNLANTFAAIGNIDDSKNLYLQLIALDPLHGGALNNLALIYTKERVYDAAIEYFKKAAALPPQDATIYFNLANAYKQTRDFESAIANYQSCLKIHENYTAAELNMAFCNLAQKRFKEGFCGYEKRLLLTKKSAPKMLQNPTIEQLIDKRVLIFTEQGFGDTIMFSRFLPQLASMTKELFFIPQKELFSLMQESFYGINAIQNIDNIEFDCSVAIGSLPYLLGIADSSQIKSTPYITTSKKIELPKINKKRIGFVYSSNPDFSAANDKSIDLTELVSIFELDGFEFYSLQTDSAKEQLKSLPPHITIHDLSPLISDFADTAALLNEMDAIFSIDTALAHLSGAMGKKTYLLLHFDADWRWGDLEDKSYWYESLELLWQEKQGQWDVPTKLLKKSLLK